MKTKTEKIVLEINNKKDEIVLASVTLFAEKGYTETTIKDIAKAVSLKTASLYNYFPSKKSILELILDIYDEYLEMASMELDDLKDNFVEMDVKTIIMSTFSKFPEDENNIYPKILKIILQEQYRNERIHIYMRDNIFTNLERKLEVLLNKMVKKGKIQPIDTKRYAKLMNYTAIAAAVEYCHYTAEEYATTQTITQFELLELIADAILQKK